MWIVDAHGYGKRFIVHTDEKLTAFMELESAIRFLSRKIGRDFVGLVHENDHSIRKLHSQFTCAVCFGFRLTPDQHCALAQSTSGQSASGWGLSKLHHGGRGSRP